MTGVLPPLEKKALMPNCRRAFLALLPGTLVGRAQEPGTITSAAEGPTLTWGETAWSCRRHGQLSIGETLAFPTSDGEAVRCLRCLGDLVAYYTPPLERKS